MMKNEQKFLRELHDLFSKYSIDLVKIEKFNEIDHRIVFYSNKRRFILEMYNEGAFINVMFEIEEFVPYRDDKEEIL